jgi:hypothetical protein
VKVQGTEGTSMKSIVSVQSQSNTGGVSAWHAGTIAFAIAAAAVLSAGLSGPLRAQITAVTGDVTATGTGSVVATVVAIGGSTAANVHAAEQGANAVLIGAGTTADLLSVGNGAFNIQPGEAGTVHHDVAIGPGAYNLYLGVGAGGGTNDVEDSVAIGYGAGNSLIYGYDGAATQAVAIGSGATNSFICGYYNNTGPIAIGYQASGGCQDAIAIGAGASNWGHLAITIGAGTVARAANSILIGPTTTDNTAGGPYTGMAFGNHAAVYANGQVVFGGDQQVFYGGVTDMFVGPPVTNFVNQNSSAMSINPCGGGLGFYETGSGANVAGCSFSINGGRGSGTGAGGALLFKTAAAGASGSSQNALTTRMSIDQHGVFTLSSFGTGIGHFSSAGVLSSGAVNLAGADVTGLLPTGNLANPAIIINGTTCVLGSSCAPSQGSGGGSAQFENQTGTTNVSITAGTGQAANSLLDIR